MPMPVPTHVPRQARIRWFRRYAGEADYRRRRDFYRGVAAECATKIVVDREPTE